MQTYFTFTKKRLFVFALVFFCITFICYQVYAVSNTDDNAKTNADRLIFIKTLGYTVIEQEPTVKTVNIPETFYDVYKNYNSLQNLAGYDLSLFKGCEVTLYTYKIKPPPNYTDECVVNLIVYKNRIIGGDVSSVSLGGFMLPLKNQSE